MVQWCSSFGLGLLLAAFAASSGEPAFAEICASAKNGLETEVNGQRGVRCTKGECRIGGGIKAGKSTFHRFQNFDNRGAIKRVKFDTGGQRNLFSWISLLSTLQASIDTLILGHKLRIYTNRQLFTTNVGFTCTSFSVESLKVLWMPDLQFLNTSTSEQSSYVG